MNKLTIDFESRSRVDIQKCGLYPYAEDETTDILMLSFKRNDEPTKIWVPNFFRRLCTSAFLKKLASTDDMLNSLFEMDIDVIEAHNASFEYVMWREVMHKKYGYPMLPFGKMRCSAAKGCYWGLPRSLYDVGKALNSPVQKDPAGYNLIMKLCKPRKPTKKEVADLLKGGDVDQIDDVTFRHDGTGELFCFWNEDPTDFENFGNYNMQDVDAEHSVSAKIPELPESELDIWRLDFEINDRGVNLDIAGIDNLIKKVAKTEENLLLEVQEITNGFIKSVRQVDNTRRWLADQGLVLKDFTKNTVTEALARTDLNPKARRILELRQILGKSSVAKLKAMKDYSCKDGRMRGLFMYYGAGTGRFTGKGPQVQNYPRDSFKDADIDNILELSESAVEALYGSPIAMASKCLRGMLTASPGNVLVSADFKQIEFIVLAWLAGESEVIEDFKNNAPVYEKTASKIYGIPMEKVDKEKRQVGKVFNLALGYQGWYDALLRMAEAYGCDLPPEEVCTEMMQRWRGSRPHTVRFWYGVADAALQTVKTGKSYSFGRIKFGIRKQWLHCRLPSGRLLSYYEPKIEAKKDKYERIREVVTYMSMKAPVAAAKPVWTRVSTYGGKLTENIVQAVSRDILTDAMLRAKKHQLKTVLHVHDEVVAEVPDNCANVIDGRAVSEFEKLMSIVPEWADGLPMFAEGWIGRRYRK